MDNNRYMLPVGTKICNGLYVVKEQLSSGGFGNTYKVEELFHGEIFAMKEFFIKGINDRTGRTVIVSNDENIATFQKQREKFKVEAERLRDLTNEHIVKVHSFFEENETSYYIMDFIDGKSMDQRKSPLKEDDAMDVLRQVLDALSAIHQVKSVEEGKERIWVHLDIKPANLMIDKNGKVTLIDFGASKQLSAESRHSSISLSQMPFTRPYAPLEQITQQVDSIGPWTDFYALGATLYALQTEKDTEIPEYSKLQDLATGKDDLENAFTFPKNMSEIMRRLIVWMMNPDRKERPQSVFEIRSYLELDTGDGETELGHVLTIKSEPAAGGEVSVEPQKKQYENGEKVSCEAKPQKGYRFQGWYNSEGVQVGTKADYSFSITGNTVLKAEFKAVKKPKLPYYLLIALVCIACTIFIMLLPGPSQTTQTPVDQDTIPEIVDQDTIPEIVDQDTIPEVGVKIEHTEDETEELDLPVEEYEDIDLSNLKENEASKLPEAIQNLLNNMVYVEGGSFLMGGTSEQNIEIFLREEETCNDVDDFELPVHNVTLSSFYISKYEITQEQWEVVMGFNPSIFKGIKRPVENVNWNSCHEFAIKLSNMTGRIFELPTEAQWEYSARGGEKSRGKKYSGSSDLGTLEKFAWIDFDSDKQTHDVGLKRPNELNLYDMSGNVFEWCRDAYYKYSSDKQVNPVGPQGDYHIIRGGSFDNRHDFSRVSARFTSDKPKSNIGFRVIMTDEPVRYRQLNRDGK